MPKSPEPDLKVTKTEEETTSQQATFGLGLLTLLVATLASVHDDVTATYPMPSQALAVTAGTAPVAARTVALIRVFSRTVGGVPAATPVRALTLPLHIVVSGLYETAVPDTGLTPAQPYLGVTKPQDATSASIDATATSLLGQVGDTITTALATTAGALSASQYGLARVCATRVSLTPTVDRYPALVASSAVGTVAGRGRFGITKALRSRVEIPFIGSPVVDDKVTTSGHGGSHKVVFRNPKFGNRTGSSVLGKTSRVHRGVSLLRTAVSATATATVTHSVIQRFIAAQIAATSHLRRRITTAITAQSGIRMALTPASYLDVAVAAIAGVADRVRLGSRVIQTVVTGATTTVTTTAAFVRVVTATTSLASVLSQRSTRLRTLAATAGGHGVAGTAAWFRIALVAHVTLRTALATPAAFQQMLRTTAAERPSIAATRTRLRVVAVRTGLTITLAAPAIYRVTQITTTSVTVRFTRSVTFVKRVGAIVTTPATARTAGTLRIAPTALVGSWIETTTQGTFHRLARVTVGGQSARMVRPIFGVILRTVSTVQRRLTTRAAYYRPLRVVAGGHTRVIEGAKQVMALVALTGATAAGSRRAGLTRTFAPTVAGRSTAAVAATFRTVHTALVAPVTAIQPAAAFERVIATAATIREQTPTVAMFQQTFAVRYGMQTAVAVPVRLARQFAAQSGVSARQIVTPTFRVSQLAAVGHRATAATVGAFQRTGTMLTTLSVRPARTPIFDVALRAVAGTPVRIATVTAYYRTLRVNAGGHSQLIEGAKQITALTVTVGTAARGKRVVTAIRGFTATVGVYSDHGLAATFRTVVATSLATASRLTPLPIYRQIVRETVRLTPTARIAATFRRVYRSTVAPVATTATVAQYTQVLTTALGTIAAPTLATRYARAVMATIRPVAASRRQPTFVRVASAVTGSLRTLATQSAYLRRLTTVSSGQDMTTPRATFRTQITTLTGSLTDLWSVEVYQRLFAVTVGAQATHHGHPIFRVAHAAVVGSRPVVGVPTTLQQVFTTGVGTTGIGLSRSFFRRTRTAGVGLHAARQGVLARQQALAATIGGRPTTHAIRHMTRVVAAQNGLSVVNGRLPSLVQAPVVGVSGFFKQIKPRPPDLTLGVTKPQDEATGLLERVRTFDGMEQFKRALAEATGTVSTHRQRITQLRVMAVGTAAASHPRLSVFRAIGVTLGSVTHHVGQRTVRHLGTVHTGTVARSATMLSARRVGTVLSQSRATMIKTPRWVSVVLSGGHARATTRGVFRRVIAPVTGVTPVARTRVATGVALLATTGVTTSATQVGRFVRTGVGTLGGHVAASVDLGILRRAASAVVGERAAFTPRRTVRETVVAVVASDPRVLPRLGQQVVVGVQVGVGALRRQVGAFTRRALSNTGIHATGRLTPLRVRVATIHTALRSRTDTAATFRTAVASHLSATPHLGRVPTFRRQIHTIVGTTAAAVERPTFRHVLTTVVHPSTAVHTPAIYRRVRNMVAGSLTTSRVAALFPVVASAMTGIAVTTVHVGRFLRVSAITVTERAIGLAPGRTIDQLATVTVGTQTGATTAAAYLKQAATTIGHVAASAADAIAVARLTNQFTMHGRTRPVSIFGVRQAVSVGAQAVEARIGGYVRVARSALGTQVGVWSFRFTEHIVLAVSASTGITEAVTRELIRGVWLTATTGTATVGRRFGELIFIEHQYVGPSADVSHTPILPQTVATGVQTLTATVKTYGQYLRQPVAPVATVTTHFAVDYVVRAVSATVAPTPTISRGITRPVATVSGVATVTDTVLTYGQRLRVAVMARAQASPIRHRLRAVTQLLGDTTVTVFGVGVTRVVRSSPLAAAARTHTLARVIQPVLGGRGQASRTATLRQAVSHVVGTVAGLPRPHRVVALRFVTGLRTRSQRRGQFTVRLTQYATATAAERILLTVPHAVTSGVATTRTHLRWAVRRGGVVAGTWGRSRRRGVLVRTLTALTAASVTVPTPLRDVVLAAVTSVRTHVRPGGYFVRRTRQYLAATATTQFHGQIRRAVTAATSPASARFKIVGQRLRATVGTIRVGNRRVVARRTFEATTAAVVQPPTVLRVLVARVVSGGLTGHRFRVQITALTTAATRGVSVYQLRRIIVSHVATETAWSALIGITQQSHVSTQSAMQRGIGLVVTETVGVVARLADQLNPTAVRVSVVGQNLFTSDVRWRNWADVRTVQNAFRLLPMAVNRYANRLRVTTRVNDVRVLDRLRWRNQVDVTTARNDVGVVPVSVDRHANTAVVDNRVNDAAVLDRNVAVLDNRRRDAEVGELEE